MRLLVYLISEWIFFLNKLPMDRAYPTDPLFIKADIICFQDFFASVSFTSSNIKRCYCYLSEAIVTGGWSWLSFAEKFFLRQI